MAGFYGAVDTARLAEHDIGFAGEINAPWISRARANDKIIKTVTVYIAKAG